MIGQIFVEDGPERSRIELPYAVEGLVFIVSETEGQFLAPFRHVERAGQGIPEGEDESEILVVMLWVAAVMSALSAIVAWVWIRPDDKAPGDTHAMSRDPEPEGQ